MVVNYYSLVEIYFHSCFSSICNMTVKLMRTECRWNYICSTGFAVAGADMSHDESISHGY